MEGTSPYYSNPATPTSRGKDQNKSNKSSPSELLDRQNNSVSSGNYKNDNNNNNNNNSNDNVKNHIVKNVKNRFSLESMDPGSPSLNSNSEVCIAITSFVVM